MQIVLLLSWASFSRHPLWDSGVPTRSTAARASARTLAGVLAAAASLALVAILGHSLTTRPADTCIMYAYGEKNTDTETVINDVNQTLADLFGDNQGPDVTAQLTELFN